MVAQATSSRRLTTRALGAALAIATLPYWEVLTGRRSGMFGDVNDLIVPQYVEVWQAIRAGEWPWWTPAVFGGHSMVGAGQYAVFYPGNAVFGFLEPVTAYRWWLLAHLWIATAGAFAWSWHRFGSRSGAAVSGIAYTGSGFAVLHLVHPPFVIAVAWLPLVFLGVDLVRERWSTGRAALVAVPLALIAFGGQPQLLWIALLGAGVYTAAVTALERDGAGFGRVAGALGLGLGLAAVQLLPLWLFSRSSQRPSLSMDAAFELSTAPHHLLTLLFPWAFGGSSQEPLLSAAWIGGGGLQHEVGTFAGATIVALAVVGLVRHRREPVVLALAVVSGAAVLVALGGSTPLGEVVYDVVPLAKSFRAWARTTLLLNLVIAVLAGAGVRELRRAPQRAVAGLGIAVLGLGAVALALPHVGSLDDHLVDGTYGLVARGLPVVFLLGLLVAVAVMARHPQAGLAALVGVCALELVAFAYPAEWRSQSAPIADLHHFYDEDEAPSFGRPHDAPGGVDRWVSDTYGFRSVSLAKDLRGVNGYDPLVQDEFADTAAGFVYDGFPTRSDFWQPGWLADVLRVSTLVLGEATIPTAPAWRDAGAVPGLGMRRWVREPQLPEAYLVGQARVATLDEVRRALADPITRLRASALVDDDTPGGDVRSAVAGLDRRGSAGRVVSADVLGSGQVVVDATRDGLLVLSHGWEEGWHASVDGRSVPVLRANGLVLGIPVPEGRHVIRVRFHPPGLTGGAVLAVLSVVVLVGADPVARRVVARRRSAPGDLDVLDDGVAGAERQVGGLH